MSSRPFSASAVSASQLAQRAACYRAGATNLLSWACLIRSLAGWLCPSGGCRGAKASTFASGAPSASARTATRATTQPPSRADAAAVAVGASSRRSAAWFATARGRSTRLSSRAVLSGRRQGVRWTATSCRSAKPQTSALWYSEERVMTTMRQRSSVMWRGVLRTSAAVAAVAALQQRCCLRWPAVDLPAAAVVGVAAVRVALPLSAEKLAVVVLAPAVAPPVAAEALSCSSNALPMLHAHQATGRLPRAAAVAVAAAAVASSPADPRLWIRFTARQCVRCTQRMRQRSSARWMPSCRDGRGESRRC